MSKCWLGYSRWITAAWLIAQSGRVLAVAPADFAVQVSAQVQSNPAQVVLVWPGSSFATSYTISRKLRDDQSWSPIATLSGSATSFRDPDVVLGAAYEYEVAEATVDGVQAYGYIYAGVEVPFAANRGRVILIVESSVGSALGPELNVLVQDLIGDGWLVQRHDVSANAPVTDVKAVIKNDYNSDPANTKAVFLFGHVPVPYSGDLNPDLHPSHLGAWPADLFYGDMDGVYTDYAVSDTSAEDPRNHNVPGDGKFDQTQIPGRVVLQVGRVDLTDLPSFAPRSELDLLRTYLNKNHGYRNHLFSVDRWGLIRDNFGEIEGDAPATDAWRLFPPCFGTDHIDVVGAGSFISSLASQSYLFAYGGGGGEYYQADGVASSTDFAHQNLQCAFYMLDGSYFGDWDSYDDLLRAAIASSGYGLAAAWTGLPHWYLHHMALGETIGFSTLVTQNNQNLYKNSVNLGVAEVHISLMGDPTLRLHVVAPPVGLSAVVAGPQSVNLNWEAAPDDIRGYYVYRAESPYGPFSRLNRAFIAGQSFTDTQAPPGPKTYMVRAIKLEQSASGTYYNPSQGSFATVGDSGGQVLPIVALDATNPSASEVGLTEGDFVITRAGPTDAPLTVNFQIGGTAQNGVDYEAIGNSVVIAAGAGSTWIPIHPLADGLVEGTETVTLTLLSSPAYQLGNATAATVNIADAPPPDQAPTISSLPDLSIDENTSTGPIAFVVSDPDTPASSLNTAASSSNPTLTPNLTLGGSGTNRTLVITPAQNQSGIATITVSVNDGTLSASTNFQLTVLAAGPTEKILAVTKGAAGVKLSLTGTAGHIFQILVSPDLLNWTPLGTGTFANDSSGSFLDSQTSGSATRFYRIESQ